MSALIHMTLPQVVASGASGLLLSLALVPLFRAAAVRFGYVAKPREDRWHQRPTALLGGGAIALSTIAVQFAVAGPRQLPTLVAGGALMFLVGFVDDVVTLKPYTKLVAEIAIASWFVFFGYRLAWSSSLTLDTLLTTVWIVGLTNALNLLDNMDGLAAGVALIAGLSLLAGNLITAGPSAESTYLAGLLGATAGFLVFNRHPASIFMGDSGSLFIGLNLAVLSLGNVQSTHGAGNVLSIVAGPVLIVLVPIFDTTLVTVLRIASGRSAAVGGRDHSSHRLVAIGLSERAAVAVLWSLAALGGLLAVAMRGVRNDWPSLLTAVFVLAMIIFAVYLGQVRIYEESDARLRNRAHLTPLVVQVMYRRRLAEVLLDMCLTSIAYYAAWRLRFSGAEFAAYFPMFLHSLPMVVGVQMLALFGVGGYRGVWQYFGLMDAVTFAKGVAAGTTGSVCLVLFTTRFENYSRAVFIIYAAILILLIATSRASFRLISEFAHRRRPSGPRVIIYGTGDVAARVVRDTLSRREGGYRMLGFIDDDPRMASSIMQGYPVLGGSDSLASLITNGAVDMVVVTRTFEDGRLETLQRLCAAHQVGLSCLELRLEHLVEA